MTTNSKKDLYSIYPVLNISLVNDAGEVTKKDVNGVELVIHAMKPNISVKLYFTKIIITIINLFTCNNYLAYCFSHNAT